MEDFTTRGGKQRLRASGTWSGRAAAARTQLRLDVDSDDVGALLGGLGLGGQLAGGKGKLGVEAGWRGGPDAFALAALDAQVAVDVKNGRLLQLEPGAGRVLGLLGIAQLPRRLTLDFRDFFDKGFAFDRIHGNVRIAQGEAGTDDLAILGPAADIHVRGSTDLRAQRFDQTIEVEPKSGNLLTVVGAVAGGQVAMSAVRRPARLAEGSDRLSPARQPATTASPTPTTCAIWALDSPAEIRHHLSKPGKTKSDTTISSMAPLKESRSTLGLLLAFKFRHQGKAGERANQPHD